MSNQIIIILNIKNVCIIFIARITLYLYRHRFLTQTIMGIFINFVVNT